MYSRRLAASFLFFATVIPVLICPAQERQAQKATLVFYRPKRFVGSALTPSVYLNGEQVARLDNGRYFVIEVAPTHYKIESSMKHNPLPVEAKPNQVLFF